LPFSWLLWVLLGLRQWGVPPTTRPGDLKPATVRGKVIAGDTGAAVRRARVTLRQVNGVDNVVSTATDAGGLFEIHNVPPGTYAASAGKEGYITGNRQTPLILAEEQEVKDLDFVLRRTGVIAGTIIDEHDEPVQGVTVSAQRKTYYQTRMQLQPRGETATTDDRGRFRIRDVPAGRYYVQALKRANPGPVSPHYATVLYPGVARLADAQVVKMGEGEELTGINIRVHESAVFSISGKVVDMATGQPAAGASLSLSPEDYGGGGSNGFASTGADGTFRMDDVAPGNYRIQVFVSRVNAGRQKQTSTGRWVQVSDRDVTNLNFTAGPGATIKGHVAALGTDLQTQARIQLMDRGMNGNVSLANVQVTSQPDGSFEIPNVQPGNYEIATFVTGSPVAGSTPSFFTSAITVGGQDVTDGGIVVPEEASVLQVNITLDSRAGTLAGTASSAGGDPLPGANIAWFSADPKKRGGMRYFGRTRAGPQGAFTAGALIPGDYLVLIWPSEQSGGTITDPDLIELVEKYAVHVSVQPMGTANQDLRLSSEVQAIAQSVEEPRQ
jgi:hypothetical protein